MHEVIPRAITEIIHSHHLPGEFLTWGDDSIVMRVNDDVWKFYPGEEFSEELLQKYKTLTDIAFRRLDGAEDVISFGEIAFHFTWRVNPITHIGVLEGIPYTISPYVEGYQVQELIDRYHDMGEITHPLQQIEAMNYHYVGQVILNKGEWINSMAGTSLIWPTAVNVKIQGNTLIITDVCSAVRYCEHDWYFH